MSGAASIDAQLAALEARLTDRISALEAREGTPPLPDDPMDLGITLNLAGVQHRLKMLLEDAFMGLDDDRSAYACQTIAARFEQGIRAILRDSGAQP